MKNVYEQVYDEQINDMIYILNNSVTYEPRRMINEAGILNIRNITRPVSDFIVFKIFELERIMYETSIG